VNAQQHSDEPAINLQEIILVIRKRSVVIIGILLIVIISAVIYNSLSPQVYEAETTLRIKEAQSLANSLLESTPIGSSIEISRKMSTYAEILKSRAVLNTVISQISQLREGTALTYDKVLRSITTLPVEDTEILKVIIHADTPDKAQLIADTLVKVFIHRMTELARTEQKTIRIFISARLQEAKKNLLQAEDRLKTYKSAEKIVDLSEEAKSMVRQFSDVYKLQAENIIRLASSQAQLANVNKQLANESPGFVGENQLIIQYQRRLAALEVQQVGLLQKYTHQHPDVMGLNAQIEATKKRLNEEIKKVVTANAPSSNLIHQGLFQTKVQTEAQIAADLAQQQAIAQVLATQERSLTALPDREERLVQLNREVTLAETIYVMLAQRYEEAQISEVMQPSNIQLIDLATGSQKPLKPNKKLNLFIALLLGLLAGVSTAFILECFFNTIDTPEDVERSGLPLLGNIPIFDAGGDGVPKRTSPARPENKRG
jgi:succinoglycan biosynthesis transport protein ExoP